MKTNLIISITLMVAFAIPSYWQPLFLVPAVIFGLLVSAIITVEAINPKLDQTKKIEKRLDQMEKTLNNFNFAKLR